jgi:hypothetical protein
MKSRIFFLGFVIMMFVITSSIVMAKDCEEYSSKFGSDIELPKFIPYKNEIFNIYVNDSVVASLKIEDRIVKDFMCESQEKSTYNVYLSSWDVVDTISESENTIDSLKENMKNKNITIKGVGFGKQVKGFFSKMGLTIASWFA